MTVPENAQPATIFKGKDVKIFINGAEVGTAQEVTVDLDMDGEFYAEIGKSRKTPYVGSLSVTARITRFYYNNYFVQLMTLDSSGSGKADSSTGDAYVYGRRYNTTMKAKGRDNNNNTIQSSITLIDCISSRVQLRLRAEGEFLNTMTIMAANYSMSDGLVG